MGGDYQAPGVRCCCIGTNRAADTDEVKTGGDTAIKKFTLQFDSAAVDNLLISEGEIAAAASLVSEPLKQASGRPPPISKPFMPGRSAR